MKYDSIEGVYAGNAAIRERFRETVGSLSDEQAAGLPDGRKWTVAQIVEHVSLVDEGMAKICAKLMHKARAEGKTADGNLSLSENFFKKGAEIARTKVEAPEIVRPVSGCSIAESLAKMDANRKIFDDIRPLFDSFDGTGHKFPHPFFGDTTAHEWLVLSGEHIARHLKQIERILGGRQE